MEDSGDFGMAVRQRLLLLPVAIPVDGNIQCYTCRMDLEPDTDDFQCLGYPRNEHEEAQHRSLHRILKSLVAKTGSARLKDPKRAALHDASGKFPSE